MAAEAAVEAGWEVVAAVEVVRVVVVDLAVARAVAVVTAVGVGSVVVDSCAPRTARSYALVECVSRPSERRLVRYGETR